MQDSDRTLIGSPPDAATHFSVHRMRPGSRNSGLRLEADVAGGARIGLFPLDMLSESWLREKFGIGSYKLQWYKDDGGGRTIPVGWSRRFGFASADAAGVPESEEADPIENAARLRRGAVSELREVFDLVRSMMPVQPPVAPQSADSEEVRELRAEVERLRVEAAEARQREVMREEIERSERRHREEMAAADTRMQALERRIHEAEVVRDNEPSDDGPDIDPQEPIVGQVIAGLVSAVMKRPETIGEVLSFAAGLAQKIQAQRPINAQPQDSAPATASTQPAAAPSPVPETPKTNAQEAQESGWYGTQPVAPATNGAARPRVKIERVPSDEPSSPASP
jgi:hypothetical protein